MKIALVSCASKKKDIKTNAEDLYISSLFKYNLQYAKKIADKVLILSAKYGLLRLDEEIEPYEKTLNKMPLEERKEWARKVISQLKEISNIKKDNFIFLAGKKYRKFILPYLMKYEIPMEGLGIGKQLKFLKEKTK